MRKKLILDRGTKFGKWEVIHTLPITKNNQTYWLCRCDCGIEQHVKLNSLTTSKSTQCISCAKKEVGLKNRKGVGEISGDMWAQLKKISQNRNLSFDLTIEEAWELFEKQNHKCVLTGEPIKFSGYPYDAEKTTAVLDLISNDSGYNINNVQWIHKDVSLLKKTMENKKFVDICKKVSIFVSKQK